MKEIIKVELSGRKVDFVRCDTDLLCVGLFSDAKGLDKINKQLNEKLDGAIDKLIELGDFKGKEGTSAVIYGNEKISARRIILVGLGEKKKVTLDTIRNASANMGNKAVEMKAKKVSMALHKALGGKFDYNVLGKVVAEGVYFGSYRYDEFVTKSEDGRLGSLEVELIDSDSGIVRRLKKGSDKGAITGHCQNLARTLANRPPNVMYPAKLAEQAKKIANQTAGLSCTVFDEKQLAQKKMGGIIAVGQGSSHKPRMIILKYTPKTRLVSKAGPIGLVGKAITFDSGGVSIKPSSHMDAMKMDMTGGAAVLATMKAIAGLALPLRVYGIICAAENAVGGDSYRPGDIITTYSGKTIEVLNTDAEGRLVLSDGISYAKEKKCDTIIDVATLTGACRVALGMHKAGVMSNNPGLLRELLRASSDSGEPIWHMPSGPEYAEELKSKIADLKNIGSKYGGACTGAAFLGEFAGESRWAHLDIAGKMEPSESLKKITTEGSIGFGVRLLVSYIMNLTRK